jgi:WD40 repeat protein
MSIQITCPGCATSFELAEYRPGRKMSCPSCWQELVPAGTGTAKRAEEEKEARWLPLLAAALLVVSAGGLLALCGCSRGEREGQQQAAHEMHEQEAGEKPPQTPGSARAAADPLPGQDKHAGAADTGKQGAVSPKKASDKGKPSVIFPPVAEHKAPIPITVRSTALFRGHADVVWSVAFRPDGKMLASGSNDKTIKLWDVASGASTATLACRFPVGSVAFSPDGQTLASGGGAGSTMQDAGELKLWDVASGKHTATLKGHDTFVTSVVFSPDSKTLASGCWDGTIKLWDVASRTNTATLTGHTHTVRCVAFSPDGKTLASAGCEDGTAKLWDVATGKETATLKPESGEVWSVAFSPDGKTVASGNEGTIKLWDAASARNTATFKEDKNRLNAQYQAVAFSRDGKLLVAAAGFMVDRATQLLDVPSARSMATLDHFAGLAVANPLVASVAFSPDGKTFASAGGDRNVDGQQPRGSIRLWEVVRLKKAVTER